MKPLKLILLLSVLIFVRCSKSEITSAEYDDYNLAGTIPLDHTLMKAMEGIYKRSGGGDNLGSEFVCKTSKNRVSFFSNKDGLFFILKSGLKTSDSSIQFSGFWRYSETAVQGKIHLSIAKTEGVSEILNGAVTSVLLNGNFDGNGISIRFDRQFSDFTKNHEFMIFGHHGVQTTSNPPFAENSLDAVRYAEGYGVNGLEYDIRLTKDNVPICIHDPTLNTRLLQKGPLSGSWNQYNFPFLHAYCKLIDGQELPSLEKVLEFFVDSTTLDYMWLDIKGDPDVFKYLEPIVRNAYANAQAKNRDVIIFAGLPSEFVIEELHKQPTYYSTNPAYTYSDPLPILAEQSLQKVLDNHCQYFGPRFSNGLLLDEVATAHANGVKVISWTLNSKAFIYDYLANSQFDGFITDFPSYVNYYYYTMK